jgi:hypothetical protein
MKNEKLTNEQLNKEAVRLAKKTDLFFLVGKGHIDETGMTAIAKGKVTDIITALVLAADQSKDIGYILIKAAAAYAVLLRERDGKEIDFEVEKTLGAIAVELSTLKEIAAKKK